MLIVLKNLDRVSFRNLLFNYWLLCDSKMFCMFLLQESSIALHSTDSCSWLPNRIIYYKLLNGCLFFPHSLWSFLPHNCIIVLFLFSFPLCTSLKLQPTLLRLDISLGTAFFPRTPNYKPHLWSSSGTFHVLIMNLTEFLGIDKAAEIFLFASPPLCLSTTSSRRPCWLVVQQKTVKRWRTPVTPETEFTNRTYLL